MPRFTKRSCADTSQTICTVVEKWTHDYSCLRYFFFDTLQPRDTVGSEGVAPACSNFSHDLGLRGGNCNGLLANTGLFLSTGNRYLFFLRRQLIPFDSWAQLLIQFSHAWRRSFVIDVSDRYSSSPWFQLLLVGSRYLLMNLRVVQFQFDFALRRLTYPQFAQTFQDFIGRIFFDICKRTSPHFVSNSWMLSRWIVKENKSAKSNTTSWARVTRMYS